MFVSETKCPFVHLGRGPFLLHEIERCACVRACVCVLWFYTLSSEASRELGMEAQVLVRLPSLLRG